MNTQEQQQNILQLNNITYHYKNSQHPALDNINLNIKQGSFIGFIGPTGAGKTTLLKIINGIIPHFEGGHFKGQVMLKGKPASEMTIAQIGRLVGTVLDDPEAQIICLDVEQELAFVMENFGIPPGEMEQRMKLALSSVGLTHLRSRSTRALSGGQKQRLAIAAALVMLPKILVLDEPTSELDPLGSTDVFQVLKQLNTKYGITILVAEQKTELLTIYCDRLVVLDQGKLALEGTVKEIFSSKDIRQLGVAIPEVTELAYLFNDNLLEPPITLAEGITYCQELIGQRRTP